MEKKRTVLFCTFCAIALVAACAGIVLALANRNATPVLVAEDPQARQTAQTLFDAVSSGDYELASAQMLGNPSMGVDRNAEDLVGKLIWKAFQDSLTFTAVGEAFATDSSVAYNYEVRHLNFEQVTGQLRERAQTLLTERVEQADDVSEVYDENNEYREDFVTKVLIDATRQVLAEDSVYTVRSFRVQLVYGEDRWWVVPEEGLLQILTGGLIH